MSHTEFSATDAQYPGDGLTVKPGVNAPGDVLFIADTEQTQVAIVLGYDDVVRLCAHLGLLIGLSHHPDLHGVTRSSS